MNIFQKCTFQLKVIMKKLLKVTEIAALPKSAYLPNYRIYRSHILIAQIEDLIDDCVIFHVPIFITFRELCRQRTLRSSRVSS